MSLDEPMSHKAAAMVESDSHPGWEPRRHPINRGDELDLRKQQLAEEIHIARDVVAQLEAEYARLDAAEVDHDPDPGFVTRRAGVDPRLFDMGTDSEQEWRVEEPALPRIISVETGGRT